MPGKVNFEKDGKGVLITWVGAITGDEIKEINVFIYNKERLDKLRYQIWDFSRADRLNISIKDIREIAMQDKIAAQTNPDQVVAIVGSEGFFNGYDRIFHIYEEIWSGYQSRTFASVAKARKWIASLVAM